jgi:hypothetical protein
MPSNGGEGSVVVLWSSLIKSQRYTSRVTRGLTYQPSRQKGNWCEELCLYMFTSTIYVYDFGSHLRVLPSNVDRTPKKIVNRLQVNHLLLSQLQFIDSRFLSRSLESR